MQKKENQTVKKTLPYLIVTLIIVASSIFIMSRVGKTSEKTPESMDRVPESVELGTTPTPVSEVNLDSKTAVKTSIDQELKWLDGEVSAGSKADFSEAGLSEEELGL